MRRRRRRRRRRGEGDEEEEEERGRKKERGRKEEEEEREEVRPQVRYTHTPDPEALNLLSETCLTLKLLSPLTPSLMFTARNKWREEERERMLDLRCVYHTHTLLILKL